MLPLLIIYSQPVFLEGQSLMLQIFWIMTQRNIVGIIRRFGISFRSLRYDAA